MIIFPQEVQKSFVAEMKMEEGIALNEALCENLFMVLVSVLNQVGLVMLSDGVFWFSDAV